MSLNYIKKLITETIIETLNEGWYDNTPHPHFSRSDVYHTIGRNPLTVDNGNHSAADSITQPSTVDFNGERFKPEVIQVSPQKFKFYLLKHFGKDNIKSTLDFFGGQGRGEKKFRDALDTVYGAAKRHNRNVIFRSIAPEIGKSQRISLFNSFLEFSFDYGDTWYIMKPEPVQKMKKSEIIIK